MNRKKILKVVVAASAIAGGIGLSSSNVHATENNTNKNNATINNVTKGKITNVSTNLRVRSDAGTNYEIIGYLYNGQEIEVNAEKGDWYRISFNGREGYVSKDYVELNQSTTSTVTATDKKGQVINVTSYLNIRHSASTSSAVIGTLKNGDTFEIISNSNGWYNIKSQNAVGFIKSDYVKEIGISTTPAAQTTKTTQNGKVVNISTNLRIRTSPSTTSSILGYLLNGQEVSITAEEGNWYAISYNNTKGYVSKEYVQKASGTSASNNAPVNTSSQEVTKNQKGQVINVTSSLNIRQSTSTSSTVLGILRNGETFDILGKNGSWYNIKTGTVTGYVSGDYVKEVSGSSSNNSGGNASQEVAKNQKGQVINVTSSLNIRQSTSTSSTVLGILRNGETFDILGKNGSWYNIKTGTATGYVSGDYVKEVSGSSSNNSGGNASQEVAKNQKGQVINVTSNLRVRSQANTSSTVLGYLLNGQTIDVTGKIGEWIKLNYNGQIGYVSDQYIKFVDGNSSNNSGNTNSTATFNSVLSAMKSQLGSPYVWGGAGENLTTTLLNTFKRSFPDQAAAGHYNRAASYANQGYRAFDCSGLMQWGFKQAGIYIGRTTWDQITNGTEVSISALKPGDLLFYSSLQHVGMYIGNGQWIEAPNSSSNVRITDVPWSKVSRARRILN
ncbi:SH3 domain-containing protein [Clostridium sp. SHJSY1]|uniref:C40 family peptidase n=1 Tax=Clostridium sp. SHJSY1 TaxID=2942483 RepID=UPI002874B9DA|nr:SH3 domain-containing protein [Clostridium sp. SHJSY1]MDS0526619.1 SH3 domain-containing protein [Clostridium sp. SHJSY1]